MLKYRTIQGDTWDKIAFKLWGSEFLLSLLLDANPKYAHLHIFSAGIELNVPEINENDTDDVDRPVWFDEAVEP